MSDPVIRVENLSKKYTIGHQKQERYTALRDVISNRAKSVWQGLTGNNQPSLDETSEEFWALKDVSFEIKQGDRVGIIGRNGAGKSTLLKILSRITEPTSGKISIKGKVASLLEVGTGFHPELTGRENIYLNGAILGMDRSDIKKKFDEIVAFAEVEKFLDTPVKRYSSGMYVRLAFAVAAHLEPEILIVDEVLAVGDAQFQKKCLGKMEDVGKEGRTVLFVSHNMATINKLCNVGILLDGGTIKSKDSLDSIISSYLNTNNLLNLENVKSDRGIILKNLCLVNIKSKLETNILTFDNDYKLGIDIYAKEKISSVVILVKIFDSFGVLISSLASLEEGIEPFTLEGYMKITFSLLRIQLLPSEYFMSLYVFRFNESNPYLCAENILSFEVQPTMLGNASWSYRKDHGMVRISRSCELTSP